MCSALFLSSSWGFFAHERINRLAVFTLPPEMIIFYKKHIDFITEASVNPDRRRYSDPEEAPRHYIDMDDYGDSLQLPKYWEQAVTKFTVDSLKDHGIVPWHIPVMYRRLRDAFLIGDPDRILRSSAELGHYVADANVPLHTTRNYNGQLTGQTGIHAFWESRLPELFHGQYDFYTGKAEYIADVQAAAWNAVRTAHDQVTRVLDEEKRLSLMNGSSPFGYETKGNQTIKVYAVTYATRYHDKLQGMVEQQMRASAKMIGDLWFTAWVEAGQPDLRRLIDYKPS